MTTASAGQFVIALGTLAAIYAFLFSFVAMKRGTLGWALSIRNAVFASAALSSLAILLLLVALVRDDFGIRYVYLHSHSSMALLYKIAALWGGQSGSLILWLWLLTLFGSISLWRFWSLDLHSFPYAVCFLSGIEVFFFMLLVLVDPPFAVSSPIPNEGQGLNPLLQNFLMLIHPPTMYMGLVGFTPPFVWALASLIRRRSSSWASDWRGWILFAWLFLTLSNVLGAAWAYVELGWGGFWAWDPVENASFMPWLSATPLVHSLMVEERSLGFRRWNVFLIFLTFFLTIFGTFITRSGFIDSVHAFAYSAMGYYFLVFLVVLFLLILAVSLLRFRMLASPTLYRFLSRQTFFHFANVIFILAITIVCFGTLAPALSNVLSGHKLNLTAAWFNYMMAPIGFLILIFTSIVPLMGWRHSGSGPLLRALRLPLFVSILIGFFLLSFGITQARVVMLSFGVCMLLGMIVREVLLLVRNRVEWPLAQRGLAALVCHFGLACMFLAFTGAAYQSERTVQLHPGERIRISGYELEYRNLTFNHDRETITVQAKVNAYKHGNSIGELLPERVFHPNSEQPSTEAAILFRPFDDLYAVLGNYDSASKTAEFKFMVNPLISFLWLGGLLMFFGTLILFIPNQRSRL